MSNTFGIIALIFGILSLCAGWFIGIYVPFLAWIFPIIAIIFGIIGIVKDDSKGMAITGLILGIISVICVAVLFVFLYSLILIIIASMMSLGP